MTISMKLVIDMLKSEDGICFDELGFFLTVLRDNSVDDKTAAYFDKCVQQLREK